MPTETDLIPLDIFGATVETGDTIVYAGRRGSETYLKKLRVTSTTPTSITGFAPDDVHRRRRTIRNFETIARVF